MMDRLPGKQWGSQAAGAVLMALIWTGSATAEGIVTSRPMATGSEPRVDNWVDA